MKRSTVIGPRSAIIALISSMSVVISLSPSSEADGEQSEACGDDRRRQDHAHRQTPPKVFEPRIGLAEEFAENARPSIQHPKGSGDDARPPQRACPRQR